MHGRSASKAVHNSASGRRRSSGIGSNVWNREVGSKQHLRIKQFYGISENAVKTQI
jgi:hypothetical protein